MSITFGPAAAAGGWAATSEREPAQSSTDNSTNRFIFAVLRNENSTIVAAMRDITRREFGIAAFGTAAVARRGVAASSPSAAGETRKHALRGVFIILTTPFTPSGEVDWDDLAREA